MQEGNLNGGGYEESVRQEEASEPPNNNALVVARIPEQPQYSSPERGQHVNQPSFNPMVSSQAQPPMSRPGANGNNTLTTGVVGEGSLAAPMYMAHPGEKAVIILSATPFILNFYWQVGLCNCKSEGRLQIGRECLRSGISSLPHVAWS